MVLAQGKPPQYVGGMGCGGCLSGITILLPGSGADDLYIAVHRLAKEAFPIDERLQSLNILWGSLAEVGYCLHVPRRLCYISDTTYEKFELEVRQVGAPLSGLIQKTRAGQS